MSYQATSDKTPAIGFQNVRRRNIMSEAIRGMRESFVKREASELRSANCEAGWQ
jgi:hypothetical protein